MAGASHRRASFILAAMFVCLVLTGLLAWQAFDAAVSHRAVAEGVLRDYAALAADEYIRRASNHVGYDGYFPLLSALTAQVRATDGLPSRESLAESLPPRASRAPELMETAFVVPLAAGVEPRVEGENPELARWLRHDFPRDDAGSDERVAVRVLHTTVGGEPRTLVHARVAEPQPAAVGFLVNRSAWESWFAESFADSPLLPPSLARDRALDVAVAITVYDDADRVVFRSGEHPQRYLTSYRDFGDTYGGIFQGARVVASIDPDAASSLVIGGLPRTRLPLMAGLILVTLGLLIAATLLFRRERAVAQLRSEFVSRVSHELRTPLTQIRMFAETLLLGRVRSEDERRRSLEIIDRESRRLTHLVENILQFSRGERGTTRLSKLPRDLAPLVRELVDEFEPLVQDEQVSMRTSLQATVAPVDEDAFRQVLLNLLDNAVKYGPDRQEIEIATEQVDGVARVSVDDEGPGVPRRDRERIWQRFHRLQRPQETASAGTGIGLSVVRELVALHGGRAWVETGSRGGSRFVVELPTAAAADAP